MWWMRGEIILFPPSIYPLFYSANSLQLFLSLAALIAIRGFPYPISSFLTSQFNEVLRLFQRQAPRAGYTSLILMVSGFVSAEAACVWENLAASWHRTFISGCRSRVLISQQNRIIRRYILNRVRPNLAKRHFFLVIHFQHHTTYKGFPPTHECIILSFGKLYFPSACES